MNTAEFIDEINRQLDVDPRDAVTFGRDDSFKLMTLLTLLKNLQQTGQDKTLSQITAMHVQRAQYADRALAAAITDNRKQTEMITNLTKSLHSALALQDAMLNEIRRLASSGAGLHGVVPVQLTVAKNNFDREMKKLLGDEK